MKPVTASIVETQYGFSLVILWSAVEQSIVITISCVPALRTIVLAEINEVRIVIGSVVRLLSFNRSRKDSTSSSGSQYYNLEAGFRTQ